MLDNELTFEIIDKLEKELVNLGLDYIDISTTYQPTKQSVNKKATIFIYKMSAPQRGSSRKQKGENKVQTMLNRAVFQFSVLAPQNSSDLTILTASDILNYTLSIFQNGEVVKQFHEKKITIEKTTSIKDNMITNSEGMNENAPMFDLTVQYQHEIASKVPLVDGFKSKIIGI